MLKKEPKNVLIKTDKCDILFEKENEKEKKFTEEYNNAYTLLYEKGHIEFIELLFGAYLVINLPRYGIIIEDMKSVFAICIVLGSKFWDDEPLKYELMFDYIKDYDIKYLCKWEWIIFLRINCKLDYETFRKDNLIKHMLKENQIKENNYVI